jgi:hypothetical protein
VLRVRSLKRSRLQARGEGGAAGGFVAEAQEVEAVGGVDARIVGGAGGDLAQDLAGLGVEVHGDEQLAEGDGEAGGDAGAGEGAGAVGLVGGGGRRAVRARAASTARRSSASGSISASSGGEPLRVGAATFDDGDPREGGEGGGLAGVDAEGGVGEASGGGEAELVDLQEGERAEGVGLPGIALEDQAVGGGGLLRGVLLVKNGAAEEQGAVADELLRLGAAYRGALGLPQDHVGVVEGARGAAGEGGLGDGEQILGVLGAAGVVGVVEGVHGGARFRIGAAACGDPEGEQVAAGGQIVGVGGEDGA